MSIFKFDHLSAYLKHFIAQLPKRGRGEVTRIARHLRVSTTLVSQVLADEKTFTPEQTQSLIGYLGLARLEAEYLVFLNHFERAGTQELKDFWAAKLSEVREKSVQLIHRVKADRVLNDQERAVFYSSPLYSAIRLFTSVGSDGQSIPEISERFDLPRARVADMLRFLIETGLCIEKEGRYFMGAQSTHVEQGSPHLQRHYGNWRLRAIHHAEALSDRELMYTALVSLSRGDFEILREEMAAFIKTFLDRVHKSPAEDIACFNMDFFWVKK